MGRKTDNNNCKNIKMQKKYFEQKFIYIFLKKVTGAKCDPQTKRLIYCKMFKSLYIPYFVIFF